MTEIAIHYRQQFFGETTNVVPSSAARAGTPRGLVGRQVANAEMLSALLRHGSHTTLHFLVDNDADARELKGDLKRDLPKDKKAVVSRMQNIDSWMAKPIRQVIWQPQPPAGSLAWTRRRVASDRVALGGVTHSLCSSLAVHAIRELVTSPTRSVDRLVCTSEAVAHTARTLINHWCEVIGRPNDPNMVQLETIPLGVDCDRHRPASGEERAQQRQRLGIPNDADVVLFVGRLSHHAKSNPLPMFAACQRAASKTGRPVYLVLAGWYASDAIKAGFESEAARVAPDVTLLNVNAMDASWRDTVWAAADLFVSLADSVQETFGLTVVEAMSRKLPVIASDWNGYRETIEHGRTGLLVPTTMVVGAGERALIEMHEGRLSYDHFLAATGQTVTVSTQAACDAVEELLMSPEKRAEMANAGFEQANARFSWPTIIRKYERLWAEQLGLMQFPPPPSQSRPADTQSRSIEHLVPSLHSLFTLYPTRWIDGSTALAESRQQFGDLGAVTQSPLSNHSETWRLSSESTGEVLSSVTNRKDAAVCLQTLIDGQAITDEETTTLTNRSELIDTVAWALKFDLLSVQEETRIKTAAKASAVPKFFDDITFATTCMGRLSHLQQTLPKMISQPGCHVVVVDYSCPDRSGQWIRENFSAEDVTVVQIAGRERFDRSEAKNAAISVAKTPWVCVIDADICVADDFADRIRHRLFPQRFLRQYRNAHGVGGTFIASLAALQQVGMHDPVFQDWGEEDSDLMDALQFIGQEVGAFPEELISHLDHDDDMRTRFHETVDRRVSHLANRIYRTAKWDIAKINGEVPAIKVRRVLYESIRKQISKATAEKTSATVKVPIGRSRWKQLSATSMRTLIYQVNIDSDF